MKKFLERVWVWISRTGKLVIFLVVFLITLRIALPYMILYFINQNITQSREFTGIVEDVDLFILLGRLELEGIFLERKPESQQTATNFSFAAERIKTHLDWGQLFSGRLLMTLGVDGPRITYVATKDPEEKPEEGKSWHTQTKEWRAIFREIIPIRLKISKIDIKGGEVHFQDPGSRPKVDMSIKKLNIAGKNFNPEDLKGMMDLEADGLAMSSGKFGLKLKINPLAPDLQFDLDARLEGLELKQINDFFRAYGNFDVEKGTFSLFAEVAVKGKEFKGYLKPLYVNLDIVNWEKDAHEGNLLQVFWESLVGAGTEIFSNQSKDRLATKIPFSGNFKSTDIEWWTATVELLKNAFIRSLLPKWDQTINLKALEKTKE